MFFRSLVTWWKPSFTEVQDVYEYVKGTLSKEDDEVFQEFMEMERQWNRKIGHESELNK
jgi:hypothetical protein